MPYRNIKEIKKGLFWIMVLEVFIYHGRRATDLMMGRKEEGGERGRRRRLRPVLEGFLFVFISRGTQFMRWCHPQTAQVPSP